MTEERIARLNELARKSKTIGLTEEEKQEQALLRQEYLAARAWRPSWTTSTLWKRTAPRPS